MDASPTLFALWLPIVLAAVLVFVASSIIHMALPYHKKDLKGLPDQDAVRTALGHDLPPGQYAIPYCGDMKEMMSPENQKRLEEGPVGVVTIRPRGLFNMGPFLMQWALYCLAVSLLAGYVASAMLPIGTDYMQVFRVVSSAAALAYVMGSIPQGIWMGRPWGNVVKDIFDGVVYALLTGGVFGWLYPR